MPAVMSACGMCFISRPTSLLRPADAKFACRPHTCCDIANRSQAISRPPQPAHTAMSDRSLEQPTKLAPCRTARCSSLSLLRLMVSPGISAGAPGG